MSETYKEYISELAPETESWVHEQIADDLARRDAEITRLRSLVKEAYEEGWEFGWTRMQQVNMGYHRWKEPEAEDDWDKSTSRIDLENL